MPLFTTCDITVDGVPYRAGHQLADDTPTGCIESMCRCGQLVELAATPADSGEDPPAESSPDAAAKPKKPKGGKPPA